MSYNEPNDLTSKYKVIGQQYSENELQDELDRAHRKLDNNVGEQFVQVVRASFEDQEEFNLTFSELISFERAYFVQRDSEIDSSNFDVDLTTGTVTFTTSFAEDNISKNTRIMFEYVPTRYKDLELWYAVLSLIRTTSLQTREGETSISVDEAKNHVEEIENSIREKYGNRLVLDHQPRFAVNNRW